MKKQAFLSSTKLMVVSCLSVLALSIASCGSKNASESGNVATEAEAVQGAETVSADQAATTSSNAVKENDDQILSISEIMPEFMNGGPAGLASYINKNLQYPASCKDAKIEGEVIVRFVVNKDGSISDATVLRGSKNEELDNEALRVVNSMPKWRPGMQGGAPARVKYTLPVYFKLK